MKKIQAIIFFGGLFVSNLVFSQQWSGSAGATGNIYRSGNVGIGTVTSPTALLHIQNSAGYPFAIERTASGQNNTLRIAFTSNPVTGINIMGGSTIYQALNPLGTSDMLFLNGTSSTSPQFILKSNGNFGIGTSNPLTTLHVNGNCLIGDGSTQIPSGYNLYVANGILTPKVKIAVVNSINWADYVFESNYPLMKLEDLENYVNTNKHLPNIPSANEVSEGGIEVADMTNRLLEKIEEMSLYIIELNKKVNQLEAELNTIKCD